jgi:hypothetical protein
MVKSYSHQELNLEGPEEIVMCVAKSETKNISLLKQALQPE